MLYNAGLDAELTPKLRTTFNVSLLRFQTTEVPQAGALPGRGARSQSGSITAWARSIVRGSTTMSIITGGVSVFTPGSGFKQMLESRTAVFSVRRLDADVLNVSMARMEADARGSGRRCDEPSACWFRGVGMRRVGGSLASSIVAAVVYAIALSAALTDYRASAASAETGPPAVQQQPATPAQDLAAEIERQIAAGNGCLTCHTPDTLSMHASRKGRSPVSTATAATRKSLGIPRTRRARPVTLRT